MANKKFLYEIFENDGTFIGILPVRLPVKPNRSQVLPLNLPQIVNEINSGQGQLNIQTNQKFDSFDEGGLIAHNNIVKMYTWDDVNHLTPILMYTGIMLTYVPWIEGGKEGVIIQCVGRSSELSADYYTSGGNFSFNKNLKASDIFEDIIDNFRLSYPDSDINYTGPSVEDSVTVLDIDFAQKKHKKAIEKIMENSPPGFWWSIESDGTANYKSKPSSATHTFNLKKHLGRTEVNKSMENVINKVIVESSAPGSPHTADDAPSQSAYGIRSIYITDTSLKTNATAQARADAELDNNKDIKRRTSLRVNSLYDIETIKVGDTCQVINYDNSGSLLDTNMQIVKVKYDGFFAVLTLEQNFLSLEKQLNTFNKSNE